MDTQNNRSQESHDSIKHNTTLDDDQNEIKQFASKCIFRKIKQHLKLSGEIFSSTSRIPMFFL